jgi:transcription elongation factor GreA
MDLSAGKGSGRDGVLRHPVAAFPFLFFTARPAPAASGTGQGTAPGVDGMTIDRIPMTREGFEKKKVELDQMKTEMTRITERVATARAMGDLSENAEYHAAREDQGMQQAKIRNVEDELARAYIVDPNNLPKDTVVFGAKVKVRDLDMDEDETFELVGPGSEDPDKGRILTTSPIGQGLLGKKKGETAEIKVPRGVLRFKVVEITFG